MDSSRVAPVLELGDVLKKSVDFVRSKGGRPKFEVEHCIADILGLRRLDLYLQFDRPLETNEVQRIRQAVFRLAQGEPLAYIQKKAPFYGHSFNVSPDVLIPRPETEILVDAVRSYIVQKEAPTGTLFDICCGSGCIGLSLKMLFPSWNIILTDISPQAVAIAKDNAHALALDVEILQGDLLDPIKNQQADIIVANPPYLTTREYETLDASVKSFEPTLALHAGPSGLEIYKRLSIALPQALRQPGFFAIEIGATQAKAVSTLMTFCTNLQVLRDLSGHDRVVVGELLRL